MFIRPIAVSVACLVAGLAAMRLHAAEDGLRTVDAHRFGIVVRCPAAWKLTVWTRDNNAFVLGLPQEDGSPPGSVSCTLGIAPETLAAVEKQVTAERESQPEKAAANAKPADDKTPRRKRLQAQVTDISAEKFGAAQAKKLARRFDAEWQLVDARGRISFECQTSLISEGTLYTFRLVSDEEHFEAYRLDFQEMLQSAQFSAPETGLQQLDGGYWLQREFRFALRLPDGWRPAFGPDEKALLFATGKHRDTITDQLQISASAVQPLDLEKLRDTLPASITAADSHAKATCKIVAQGAGAALETMIETQPGETAVITLERRFKGTAHNYEIRVKCEAAEFKKQESALRKTLDSFREVAETPQKERF